ncbi:Hypothetical protein CINCED_3A000741 [Cinara cedri]|uniref:Uncharacterized protein n=1 Tax=Cinara cedri TaxID=506608 RepID=A0A5E4LWW8_9HEMI|nr:Hypothetical protein CINCED_3A000741 [Cinara cedri]
MEKRRRINYRFLFEKGATHKNLILSSRIQTLRRAFQVSVASRLVWLRDRRPRVTELKVGDLSVFNTFAQCISSKSCKGLSKAAKGMYQRIMVGSNNVRGTHRQMEPSVSVYSLNVSLTFAFTSSDMESGLIKLNSAPMSISRLALFCGHCGKLNLAWLSTKLAVIARIG